MWNLIQHLIRHILPYSLNHYAKEHDYSFKNDLVFDPFGGSGTFGEVAAKKERNFFLTEIDKEYFERIKERLSKHETEYLNIEEFKKWMQQEK